MQKDKLLLILKCTTKRNFNVARQFKRQFCKSGKSQFITQMPKYKTENVYSI